MPRQRKRKKLAEPRVVEKLDGPTDAQLANGRYDRETMLHSDNGNRVTIHINRGATTVIRWHSANRLTDRQLHVIDMCETLWRWLGLEQSVTAQYGERIRATGSAELRAAKVLTAKEDLARFQGYVSKAAWNVFENVCRFHMTAGQAGGELGYGSRSAEVRAHTLVCEVADRIIEREGL